MIRGPVDPWQFDSVAYTGVNLLNYMTEMQRGEQELMKMDKHEALKELKAGRIVSGVHTEVVSYECPGKMILAQGSEVLHHVTTVFSPTERYKY